MSLTRLPTTPHISKQSSIMWRYSNVCIQRQKIANKFWPLLSTNMSCAVQICFFIVSSSIIWNRWCCIQFFVEPLQVQQYPHHSQIFVSTNRILCSSTDIMMPKPNKASSIGSTKEGIIITISFYAKPHYCQDPMQQRTVQSNLSWHLNHNWRVEKELSFRKRRRFVSMERTLRKSGTIWNPELINSSWILLIIWLTLAHTLEEIASLLF